MSKLLYTALLILLPGFVFGQLYEDKSNLYLSANKSFLVGEKTYNDNSMVAALFYPNFSNVIGASAKYINVIKPNFSAGISIATILQTTGNIRITLATMLPM